MGFVHASFKYVSHALISKLLSFIGNFEIRVLSSWEIDDFVKLDKLWVKLTSEIDKLGYYN